MKIRIKKIRARFKSILIGSAKSGFQKAFQLGGSPIELPKRDYILDDSTAIMSDWKKAGTDICNAQNWYGGTELRGILSNEE